METPTIKSLDDLKALADGRTIYVRYSRSHTDDIERGYSLDHSSKTREPGLSVQEVSQQDWLEYRGWVVGLLVDYGSRLHYDDQSYGWIAIGEKAGTDSDGCPTIKNVKCLATIDRKFALRCMAYRRDRSDRERTDAGVNDNRPWPQPEEYGL